MAAPLIGAKDHFPKIIGTSGLSQSLSIKLIEKISGFKTSENDPSKVIIDIDAPVQVIANPEGDVYFPADEARELVENAKNGELVLVKSEHRTLADRHIPEFNNPRVIDAMTRFILRAFR